MSQLTLVKSDKTEWFCGVIEDLEVILSDDVNLDRTKYKNCLAWLVTTEENQCRIIFDLQNQHLGSIGKHVIIDDEYELVEAIDEAFKDGFDSIFVHLNFRGAK